MFGKNQETKFEICFGTAKSKELQFPICKLALKDTQFRYTAYSYSSALIMAFKSFKHKVGYAKNFNRSAASTSYNNGTSTQFFDPSYSHTLRDNQSLGFYNNQYSQNDTSPSCNSGNNNNYNNNHNNNSNNSNNNNNNNYKDNSQNNKQFTPYTVLGANPLDFDPTSFIVNHFSQPQTNQFSNNTANSENGNTFLHSNSNFINDGTNTTHNGNSQIDYAYFNYSNQNSYHNPTMYQNPYMPMDYRNNSNNTNNTYYSLSDMNSTLNKNRKYYSTLQQTEASGHYVIDNRDPWGEDLDNELNKENYLNTHIEKINEAFKFGRFNMINSLYQSLKRNDIVPPLDIYEKIFISFDNRSFDNNNQNLNDKMWQLLICYQDMINNKLKPTIKIYNVLLLQIFKNSIIAFETNNLNGFDFFKIGSELIHTINKNNKLSNETINYYLLAMNIFGKYSIDHKLVSPTNNTTLGEKTKDITEFNNNSDGNNITTGFLIPDLVQLKKEVIDLLPSYNKDSFYFISLVRLASLKNDSDFVKQMYKEFLLELSKTDNSNTSLKQNQFEIYSIFIYSLIECGEENIATKIFNNILVELQKQPNTMRSRKNISLVISNYLIPLSKIDCQKAYDMWSSFNKLDWVPEFSYVFYLLLMSNSFHNWSLTKKIYDYIFPMERQFKTRDFSTFRLNPRNKLSNYLLYPMNIENVIDSLMDYALQLRDDDIIAKLLEESIVKNFAFSQSLYPFIFNYLKNINVPDEYLLKFINSQGNLCPELSFINAIVQYFKDDKMLNQIVQLDFFQKICANVKFVRENINNLSGLGLLLDSIWKLPITTENYPLYLKLYGVLITRLNDFDTLSPTLNTNEKDLLSQLDKKEDDGKDFDLVFYIKFKDKITESFIHLVKNCKTLNIDTSSIDPVISQAIKLINIPEEYLNIFTHPGDWDKSYPLSLVSKIKNDPNSTLKEFERLYNQGYCFDYSTYKEFIFNKIITPTILHKVFQFDMSRNESIYLKNMMVNTLKTEQIQLMLLNDLAFFRENFVPYLKQSSLLKILECMKTSPFFHFNSIHFIKLAGFPYMYRSLSRQIEFKEVIGQIYELLFQEERYDSIIHFNDQCRVINLEILLKSYIRSGNKNKFNEMFTKYNKSLTPEQIVDIRKEYEVENARIEKLMNPMKADVNGTPIDTSFAKFIQSFTTDEITVKKNPENLSQLVNGLSSLPTLDSLIPYFEKNIENIPEYKLNNDKQLKIQIRLGVSSQILENLLKASNIFVNYCPDKSQIPIAPFKSRIRLYYNFKTYLRDKILLTDDLLLLVKIWSNISPTEVVKLLDNIIETIYLEEGPIKVGILHLPHRLRWKFNKSTLNLVLDAIEFHCQSREDLEHLTKIKTLKQQFAMD